MDEKGINDQVMELVAKIVRRYMPSEITVFELKRKKQRLVSPSAFVSDDADHARDLTSDFGPSEKILLESVPLVLGSIKAVAELFKTLKDIRQKKDPKSKLNIAEIQKKWSDSLVKEGLSAERASQVTSTFAGDLAGLFE
jgi:hypothetical protein